MNGERGDVACTVLIGRHELNESSEAALDAVSGCSSALHVHVFADEHDSGADLKVVVDALDKPASCCRRLCSSRVTAFAASVLSEQAERQVRMMSFSSCCSRGGNVSKILRRFHGSRSPFGVPGASDAGASDGGGFDMRSGA
jgi:hypothetical protein